MVCADQYALFFMVSSENPTNNDTGVLALHERSGSKYLAAEVGFFYIFTFKQLFTAARQCNPPVFKDVSSV